MSCSLILSSSTFLWSVASTDSFWTRKCTGDGCVCAKPSVCAFGIDRAWAHYQILIYRQWAIDCLFSNGLHWTWNCRLTRPLGRLIIPLTGHAIVHFSVAASAPNDLSRTVRCRVDPNSWVEWQVRLSFCHAEIYPHSLHDWSQVISPTIQISSLPATWIGICVELFRQLMALGNSLWLPSHQLTPFPLCIYGRMQSAK